MLLQSNALHIPLTAGCVQMVATSPPYWGLRKYEGEQTFEWPAVSYAPMPGLPELTIEPMRCEFGLEPTPEAYIGHLVAVFREVRRVLREDGTCWLNLGDSYAANRTEQVSPTKWQALPQGQSSQVPPALKPKDLVGIPWRAAFALQADGWYLRSDVIWAKKNCMPESVTDRPTKAHEYVFLLAKAARYYYDADAVREPHVRLWDATNGGNLADVGHKKAGILENRDTHPKGYPLPNPAGRNRRTVWHIATRPFAGAHFAVWPPALVEPMVKAGSAEGDLVLDPFNGSGTTGMVARNLGRRYVGLDVGYTYLHDIAKPRLSTEFGAGKVAKAGAVAPLETLPLFASAEDVA